MTEKHMIIVMILMLAGFAGIIISVVAIVKQEHERGWWSLALFFSIVIWLSGLTLLGVGMCNHGGVS